MGAALGATDGHSDGLLDGTLLLGVWVLGVGEDDISKRVGTLMAVARNLSKLIDPSLII